MNTKLTIHALLVVLFGLSTTGFAADAVRETQPPKPIRIGAVAYAPSAVTIFNGLTRYLNQNGLASDYVLYSNYDALVQALHNGEIDIAWNTPLAHAQYHVLNHGRSQTLVMRDVDCNVRSTLIVRKDSGIKTIRDLAGRSLTLGSNQAAEATVLPRYFLKKEGVDFGHVKIVSLDAEVDSKGNPCASPEFVLRALRDGRSDAGIITLDLWNREKNKPQTQDSLTQIWTSPPFSHCVFTAAADFDKNLAHRFTQLMTAMDPNDSSTADVMRLEGTKKWLPGSPDGFVALVDAVSSEYVQRK